MSTEQMSEHMFDWKDGWCYAHRDFCNMAASEPETDDE